jgi:exopolysaccharide biosynthesis polyprenyl glycosylphosphotransferase
VKLDGFRIASTGVSRSTSEPLEAERTLRSSTEAPSVPGFARARRSPEADTATPVQVDLVPPQARPAGSPTAGRSMPTGTSFSLWVQGYVRWLPVVDVLVALLAAVLGLAVLREVPMTSTSAIVAMVAFPLGFLASLWLARCYEVRVASVGTEEVRRSLVGSARLAGVLGVVAYLSSWIAARSLLLVALPVTVLVIVLVRVAARVHLARMRSRGEGRRRVLVLGTERSAAEMIRNLALSKVDAFDVVGVLTDASLGDEVEGVPVLGRTSDVRRAVISSSASAIIVAPWSPISQDGVRRLSWDTADLGVELYLSPNVMDVAGSRINVQITAGVPMLHIDAPEFGGVARVVKTVFDRTAAMLGLILISPVLLAIAIAVRASSPGPAIFRQERVGKGGTTFTMYKFRSMREDAEQVLDAVAEQNKHDGGPMFKATDDPRVTRCGAFIRRYSLDELPQLWNVVKGDMALVGPRPPLPREVSQYDDTAHRRLLVRPGLTGLWQVSGRSDLTWEESVRLDLYYIDNWSVVSDIAILGRTGSAVINGKGAY